MYVCVVYARHSWARVTHPTHTKKQPPDSRIAAKPPKRESFVGVRTCAPVRVSYAVSQAIRVRVRRLLHETDGWRARERHRTTPHKPSPHKTIACVRVSEFVFFAGAHGALGASQPACRQFFCCFCALESAKLVAAVGTH